ncbi:MAG: hypothetical protein LBL94_09015 [Prevotellaceae bacterium]|nr:hypothetical protein [Prevotellaceae bacterium]
MKKTTKFLLLGMTMVSISCAKDEAQKNDVETLQPNDVVELIVSNPARYIQDKSGVEKLMADLHLTDEQQQICYQEQQLAEQLVAKQNTKAKHALVKNVIEERSGEEEVVTADVFSGLSELMIAYADVKGISEHWQSAFGDFVTGVGAIVEKIEGSSIVVDVDNLLQKEFGVLKKEMLEKYALTELDKLQLTTMADNTHLLISNILKDDSMVYGASSSAKRLQKGWLKDFVKVVTQKIVFSVSIVVGAAVGLYVCSPCVVCAKLCAGAGAIAGAYIGGKLVDEIAKW